MSKEWDLENNEEIPSENKLENLKSWIIGEVGCSKSTFYKASKDCQGQIIGLGSSLSPVQNEGYFASYLPLNTDKMPELVVISSPDET